MKDKKTMFNKIISNLKINADLLSKYEKDTVFKTNTRMIGKTCKGKNSENNDSIAIATHPKDENLKLMVMASGKGKIDNMSSSKYTTKKIKQWFSNTSCDEIKDLTMNFRESIDSCMKNISKNLSNANDDNGTSVILAVVGPEYTCVANIGNLRCYISKEGRGNVIKQVNEEDSELWKQYRNEYFTDKEEFRFHIARDKNVAQIGLGKNDKFGYDNFTSCYYFETSSFDKLYLFSRGVIESISENKLNTIDKEYLPDDGIKKIMTLATDNKTERFPEYNYWCDDYTSVTHGDKDTSVCVLVKKK